MSVPTPPQYEPRKIKDAKNRMMTESLLTSFKKAYENSKNPTKNNRKAKKDSLINTDNPVFNNPFQIREYPY